MFDHITRAAVPAAQSSQRMRRWFPVCLLALVAGLGTLSTAAADVRIELGIGSDRHHQYKGRYKDRAPLSQSPRWEDRRRHDRHRRHWDRRSHRDYRPRGRMPRGCHPVYRSIRGRHGRWVTLIETQCYDRRGFAYVLPGSARYRR